MRKNKKKSDLVFWRNYHDKQQFLSSTLSDKSKRLIRITEDKSTTLIIAPKFPLFLIVHMRLDMKRIDVPGF
jgi:hypothetical protein